MHRVPRCYAIAWLLLRQLLSQLLYIGSSCLTAASRLLQHDAADACCSTTLLHCLAACAAYRFSCFSNLCLCQLLYTPAPTLLQHAAADACCSTMLLHCLAPLTAAFMWLLRCSAAFAAYRFSCFSSFCLCQRVELLWHFCVSCFSSFFSIWLSCFSRFCLCQRVQLLWHFCVSCFSSFFSIWFSCFSSFCLCQRVSCLQSCQQLMCRAALVFVKTCCHRHTCSLEAQTCFR